MKNIKERQKKCQCSAGNFFFGLQQKLNTYNLKKYIYNFCFMGIIPDDSLSEHRIVVIPIEQISSLIFEWAIYQI